MALGAGRAAIFADVLKGAIGLTGVGAVIGLAGALACGRLIAGLLFVPTTIFDMVWGVRYLQEAGKHTSERERHAMDAEREMVALKKAQFMMNKLSEEFTGFITTSGCCCALGSALVPGESIIPSMITLATWTPCSEYSSVSTCASVRIITRG